jgi:hypothetical protein
MNVCASSAVNGGIQAFSTRLSRSIGSYRCHLADVFKPGDKPFGRLGLGDRFGSLSLPGDALGERGHKESACSDQLQIFSTDRILFGFAYLSEADIDLSGDLKTSGLQGPFQNLLGPAGETIVTGFDRDWKDTWHVGGAFKYNLGEKHLVAMGISYDSSVVTSKDHTADLPLDEQFRVAAAFGKDKPIGFGYSVSGSWVYFGEGKMDQTTQGERFKGEFDTNYLIFVAASITYKFLNVQKAVCPPPDRGLLITATCVKNLES